MNHPPLSHVDTLCAAGAVNRYGRRTRLLPEEHRLAERIAAEHGVRVVDIVGPSRYPRVALARHHFIAVLRWSTFMSYPDIGALVGHRDHTTIMAAEDRYDRELNGEAGTKWRGPHGGPVKVRRYWGCPVHQGSIAPVPAGRHGPHMRFCHWVDAGGDGRECGLWLVPRDPLRPFETAPALATSGDGAS